MIIQILPMNAGHAPDVQKLSEQLGYPLSLTETERNIKEMLTAKDHVAFAALYNEKLVGWIHAFRCLVLEGNPFIEIGGLVVDEDYRGKGVGKKLVESIRNWCLENGFYDIRVRSNVKRKEAHKFYTATGFRESKEQKVFQLKL
jgi:GNAT superfamily N-acetyltransferase